MTNIYHLVQFDRVYNQSDYGINYPVRTTNEREKYDPEIAARIHLEIERNFYKISVILRTKYGMNPEQIRREINNIRDKAMEVMKKYQPELFREDQYLNRLRWYNNYLCYVLHNLQRNEIPSGCQGSCQCNDKDIKRLSLIA